MKYVSEVNLIFISWFQDAACTLISSPFWQVESNLLPTIWGKTYIVCHNWIDVQVQFATQLDGQVQCATQLDLQVQFATQLVQVQFSTQLEAQVQFATQLDVQVQFATQLDVQVQFLHS
jgi:hypothetical protein